MKKLVKLLDSSRPSVGNEFCYDLRKDDHQLYYTANKSVYQIKTRFLLNNHIAILANSCQIASLEIIARTKTRKSNAFAKIYDIATCSNHDNYVTLILGKAEMIKGEYQENHVPRIEKMFFDICKHTSTPMQWNKKNLQHFKDKLYLISSSGDWAENKTPDSISIKQIKALSGLGKLWEEHFGSINKDLSIEDAATYFKGIKKKLKAKQRHKTKSNHDSSLKSSEEYGFDSSPISILL
jgi:hypothetical protein